MTDDSLSDEDKALFREHMREVHPLKGKGAKIKTIKPKPSARPPKKPPKELQTQQNHYLSDVLIDTVFSETILSYCRPSLPHKQFKELKNGRIRWGARLDLHGVHAEKASELLLQFIQTQRQAHIRCVLIIHGKGGHLGAPPILKNLINRWLPQIEEVLAFHSTLPKDGGNGAVYVLLKKMQCL
jgi:DNA-nicking Smr family endonuclease